MAAAERIDPETGTGYYGIHFLTPETDRTTLYHFTAVRWNVLTEESANEQIREKISVMRRFAFAEMAAQSALADALFHEPRQPIGRIFGDELFFPHLCRERQELIASDGHRDRLVAT